MTTWEAYQIEALAIYNEQNKVNAVLWTDIIDFNAVDIAVEFSESGTAYIHNKSGVSYVKGAVVSFEHWQAIQQGRVKLP